MPRLVVLAKRRLFPIAATTFLVAIAMATSTWWGPHIAGSSQWQLPNDLWGTLFAARRVIHLDISGLYTYPTGLVSFPGAALLLVPIVALIDAAGLGLGIPGPGNPHPASWALAGPYEIALSAIVLFAVDAIAEKAGVSKPKRFVLAGSEAVALWSVAARWGHPEDAVAVGLLLYATLALRERRFRRSAWLCAVAISVQPLVLLALPVLLVTIEPRKVGGYLLRAAAFPGALVGLALAANFHATLQAIGNQPNWPTVDHPTPWIVFAPHLSHGAVAAGPARAVALVLACACAVVAERRWNARPDHSGGPDLDELIWWVAVALFLRCAFESVMVAYYIWPPLAVALASASRSWYRLGVAAVMSAALTFLSQIPWHGRWGWWSMVVAGTALVIIAARPTSTRLSRATSKQSQELAINVTVVSRKPGDVALQ